jgi:multidrug efflux system outer membrane protein
VAADYYTLRSLDAQEQILARNVELYRNAVALTDSQFKTGMVDQTALYQARTLLDSTLAQETDIRRQRADEEHAIAILLGKPPSALDLPARPLDVAPPAIPAGLPVELLRRRPDVAEAEQNLIAASAQIGVAQAGFLPTVTLTGVGGMMSSDTSHLLEWSRRDWSLGAAASQPVFEGGLLTANLRQAQARYRELSATYRSTVLVAFQNVEDSLNDLHQQAEEARSLDRAVKEAREYLRLAQVQYQQGMVTYLIVIDAERTLLTNELAQAQTLNQQMTATVLLIKAVGGGWDAPAAQPKAP